MRQRSTLGRQCAWRRSVPRAIPNRSGMFTGDLHRLADWFAQCGIKAVVMESAGVYWIPIYEILEQRGFEVRVVNARDAKHVPGRKADVSDAVWLQRLHEFGLPRGSFRPQGTVAALRAYLRQRERLLDYAAAHIQHERLMRLQALKARPNVLDRTFEAAAPNRKWIADFTYVCTAEGWLYVAAVIDLFSRRVVGWSMRAAMTAQLVTDALVMAIWRRGKPDALLHHSDRGSQYTSEQFQKLMADHGVVCSMSRSGNVWDNAAMESFFSSLKTERTGRKTYRTRDEAKADVFDYIERFYNSKRRHSRIGYMSPMEFERQAGLA